MVEPAAKRAWSPTEIGATIVEFDLQIHHLRLLSGIYVARHNLL